MDLIIFFEVVSSPIRMVQRMGRTGRKRSGRVVMLCQSVEEASKVEKSTATAGRICHALREPNVHLKMFVSARATTGAPLTYNAFVHTSQHILTPLLSP